MCVGEKLKRTALLHSFHFKILGAKLIKNAYRLLPSGSNYHWSNQCPGHLVDPSGQAMSGPGPCQIWCAENFCSRKKMTTFFCRLQPLISTPPEIAWDQWHNSPLRRGFPRRGSDGFPRWKTVPLPFWCSTWAPWAPIALEVSRDVSSINACDAVDSARSFCFYMNPWCWYICSPNGGILMGSMAHRI